MADKLPTPDYAGLFIKNSGDLGIVDKVIISARLGWSQEEVECFEQRLTEYAEAASNLVVSEPKKDHISNTEAIKRLGASILENSLTITQNVGSTLLSHLFGTPWELHD